MNTVWKFPIEATERQVIGMPTGARLLHVEAQGSGVGAQPCLWVMCNTESPRVGRVLGVCGTGHPAEHVAGHPHVGTFLLGHGALVFHVFDLGEEKAP